MGDIDRESEDFISGRCIQRRPLTALRPKTGRSKTLQSNQAKGWKRFGLPALLTLLLCLVVPTGLAAEDSAAARYRLSIDTGTEQYSLEVQTFEVPGKRKSRRVVICPDTVLPGLPLSAISFDRKGKSRPELFHPRQRMIVETFLDLFEADAIVGATWREPAVEGSERIWLSSLKLRDRFSVVYRCEQATPEDPRFVHVNLEAPVRESGKITTELKSLEWKFELAEDGEIRRGTLERELVLSAGAIAQRKAPRIEFEVLEREILEAPTVRDVVAEYELLAPVARALVPGQGEEAITAARKNLEKYRKRYPEGRLLLTLPHLETRLDAIGEGLASRGDPDARADRLIGQPAPDFTLKGLDDQDFSLSSLLGKPVVLSFWGYT